MARYRIPISPRGAYQTFTAELSGRTIRFDLRWMTLYGFYAVDLYESGEAITLGRGLHPGMDLVKGLNSGLGSITLEGDAPTIDNLGIANRLIYDDANG